MPVAFLDSSALVKRYDRSESGSDRVRALCRRRTGQTILISRMTRVEVASAFARKLREGRLSPRARDGAWRLFHGHYRAQYRTLDLDEAVWLLAENLLSRHPLRAYDAVQLASALRADRLLAGISPDFTFCTGDRTQGRAARSEGLRVEIVG